MGFVDLHSHYLPGIDDELIPDIQKLIREVGDGDRVVQPRLRHRYQADRHGLSHQDLSPGQGQR